MNSSACAMRLTRSMSARVACGVPYAMFSRDRAVEQEVVLQHDAEVRAIFAQPQVEQLPPVDEHASAGAAG